MTPERARALLAEVNGELSAHRPRSQLLDDIGWSREVEERFFAQGAERLPEVTYEVDRPALDGEIATFARLEGRIEGDEPIAEWLRAVLHSHIDRNRLLLAVGSPAFGAISAEIYGGSKTRFFGLAARNIDLAEHLFERLRVHGWDAATDAAAPAMDAPTFAAALARRVEERYPGTDLKVVVDPHCTSKAIAGMTKVRVRADATFLQWEADGLFSHEVETHAFSAQNGSAQPFAPFLKAGGPRTTPTQEGLAVFSELYGNALAAPRLERLAVRVKLVALAEEGGSFLDLYRFLLGRGYAPREAYFDAARICRGGRPEGGAPFTKDACYLAGLLHVYAFLAAFVRGGFRDETELLLAGRIALDDVLALAELQAMGLIARPQLRPRWLDGWSTLLAYFSFASFLGTLDMAAVTAHYERLIARAEAARPPPSR